MGALIKKPPVDFDMERAYYLMGIIENKTMKTMKYITEVRDAYVNWKSKAMSTYDFNLVLTKYIDVLQRTYKQNNKPQPWVQQLTSSQ